jgi:hypothetical protein
MSEHAITGGCQCGAVRYRVEQELDDPHLCHCRMCQKAAGNYFMPLGGAKPENLKITRGKPTWFNSSDPVKRGFCAACGTPLFFAGANGSYISVTLGSLDDPTSVPPVSVYGVEAKMAWIADICAKDGPITESDDAQQDVLADIRATNHQHPDHDTDVWPEEGQ